MKSGLLILFLFFLSGLNKVNSQNALVINANEDLRKSASPISKLPVFEFRVSVTEQQISEISTELTNSHEFGELISKKFYLLDSKYTFEVPMVPGNPQVKTMVRKPVIYESVYKIEKYLRKLSKKGEMSLENATTIMNKVLDVANCILTVETTDFEKAIEKRKDPHALVQLYMNQVNLIN